METLRLLVAKGTLKYKPRHNKFMRCFVETIRVPAIFTKAEHKLVLEAMGTLKYKPTRNKFITEAVLTVARRILQKEAEKNRGADK